MAAAVQGNIQAHVSEHQEVDGKKVKVEMVAHSISTWKTEPFIGLNGEKHVKVHEGSDGNANLVVDYLKSLVIKKMEQKRSS